jgi:dihydrofolate reductase
VTPEIVLIYARANNGAIGRNGDLPWKLPADLKRFKALTMGPKGTGLPMVMGRKTFESLPGLLPGRRHIVLSRHDDWQAEGAEVAGSPNHAIDLASTGNDSGEIAVIGGAAIYELFWPLATRIELTQIHADYTGDTFMPAPDEPWELAECEDHPAQDAYPAFSFQTFRKAAEA